MSVKLFSVLLCSRLRSDCPLMVGCLPRLPLAEHAMLAPPATLAALAMPLPQTAAGPYWALSCRNSKLVSLLAVPERPGARGLLPLPLSYSR